MHIWMIIHAETIKTVPDMLWADMHPSKVQYRPFFNGTAFAAKLKSAITGRCIVEHEQILRKEAEWQRRHSATPETGLAKAHRAEIDHLEEEFRDWARYGFIADVTAAKQSRIKWHEVTIQVEIDG